MHDQTTEKAPAQSHHLQVQRTARYFTLGTLSAETREIWFVVHGYGQLAEYFIRHFRGLDDGTRYIVAPEGLSRFYVKEWTRVGASWITKEDRPSEMEDYLGYLKSLEARILEELEQNGGKWDNVRIWALGFSQGVTTLTRWIVRGGFAPDRLICWAGGFPAEVDLAAHKDLFERMKTTFVVGTEDEFITPEVLDKQKSHIAESGLTLDFVSFNGAHVMNPQVLRTTVEHLREGLA
ncbi:MAG: phospholipase [Candidatus Kapabacteria bacterium]|nr:phospholipase [Candidatus Kapabacteria bacterium]